MDLSLNIARNIARQNHNSFPVLSLFISIFLLLILIVNLEVSQLVGILGTGNHAQPVTQVVFLQVVDRLDSTLVYFTAINTRDSKTQMFQRATSS
ncbi:hypothetical protein MAR_005517 [Mya arenaria]|uniref:Uncharacterized protein n=1 Tax=Mya arenaria TaxID=6604 RepID=A0ABY7EZQ9_MYAAR|nr:hypothetical protein MAR_005517 [Mya arenaria]